MAGRFLVRSLFGFLIGLQAQASHPAPQDEDAVENATGQTCVVALKCEYRTEPLDVDTVTPKLSWQLLSQERCAKQTAYQVLVSSSRDLLSAEQGDLWDNGKVLSSQNIHVKYAGHRLPARTDCFWKVRVWDHTQATSEWSETAHWKMGLLARSDWQAEWIGYDRVIGSAYDPSIPYLRSDEYSLRVAEDPEYENQLHLPPAPFLRSEFRIGKPVMGSFVYVSALGLYELYLNGRRVSDDCFRPGWTDYRKRVQYQVYDITEYLRDGANVVGVVLADGWYAGYFGSQQRQHYGGNPRVVVQIEANYADATRAVFGSNEDWKASYGPILEADILH